MPELELFEIKDYVVGDEIHDIVCQATTVATSQNKKVWITIVDEDKFSWDPYAHITELKIERKQNKNDLGFQTLNIRLKSFCYALYNLEGYLKTYLEVNSLTFQIFRKSS